MLAGEVVQLASGFRTGAFLCLETATSSYSRFYVELRRRKSYHLI